jgi:hypothetical protein
VTGCQEMLTPYIHLIQPLVYPMVRVWLTLNLVFLIVSMRLITVCNFHLYILHKSHQLITVCYLYLYILYTSYEIDHCLLSSPLQSIQVLWDWSLFVIFTFTVYTRVMRLITVCYLHLNNLYRSYEIDHFF